MRIPEFLELILPISFFLSIILTIGKLRSEGEFIVMEQSGFSSNKIYSLLALPAFYYVFILGIDKWALTYLFRENIITPISLASTLIFFYLSPFIITEILKKKKEFFYFKNLLIFGIIFILLLFYFSYDREYSGGIFYISSKLVFDNNIVNALSRLHSLQSPLIF